MTKNSIYTELKMYNEFQKRRFIKTQPVSVQTPNERAFKRASELEKLNGTDLCNFNLPQIEQFLTYLSPTTLTSSRGNFYLVRNYITWAISEGIRENNINPLEILNDTDFLKKFVDSNRKTFFTKQEIDEIVDGLVNAQDQVVIQLLFEGIGSKLEEILNITRNSIVDENKNTLLISDGERERHTHVSDKCMRLIDQAFKQQVYIKKNGDTLDSGHRSGATIVLGVSPYMIKATITNNKDNGDKRDKFAIMRKMSSIKGYFDLKELNSKMITKSGMLYELHLACWDEEKQLHREPNVRDYEYICDKFGYALMTTSQGYPTYNYTRLKQEFLNLDTLKDIYE